MHDFEYDKEKKRGEREETHLDGRFLDYGCTPLLPRPCAQAPLRPLRSNYPSRICGRTVRRRYIGRRRGTNCGRSNDRGQSVVLRYMWSGVWRRARTSK